MVNSIIKAVAAATTASLKEDKHSVIDMTIVNAALEMISPDAESLPDEIQARVAAYDIVFKIYNIIKGERGITRMLKSDFDAIFPIFFTSCDKEEITEAVEFLLPDIRMEISICDVIQFWHGDCLLFDFEDIMEIQHGIGI